MTQIRMAEAKAKFSEVVERTRYLKERIVINKGRSPVAVILSYEDYKNLEELEDAAMSKVAEESVRYGKFFTLKEAARKLKIVV